MPKSRKKRQRRQPTTTEREASAAQASSRRLRWRLGAAAAGLAVVAVVAIVWYRDAQVEDRFLEHARDGQAALERVITTIDEGGGHVAPGQNVRYLSDPPTTGIHDPTWIDPGIYRTIEPRTKLVHSLEHGMIVIYYDAPPSGVFATIERWAGLYAAPWSGIVVAPKPRLGEAIVLAAWNKILRLDTFDADAAAAFIDRYRGRGPEHPVR